MGENGGGYCGHLGISRKRRRSRCRVRDFFAEESEASRMPGCDRQFSFLGI